MLIKEELHNQLEDAVERYNKPSFIAHDPICIPHGFSRKQDIEIAAFWTAMLAWGRRQTIIDKANQLMELMGNTPYEFILHHKEKDRAAFTHFVHRTFQPTDALYFLDFLQRHYRTHKSLESAFSMHMQDEDKDTRNALSGFHHLFFDHPLAPDRTRKHVATPLRGSSCKRLNMFLRWMVRQDDKGVDFGIWKNIHPSQLLLPLDVHVGRVARQLGLLGTEKSNWKAVLELTETLRTFDADDPAKYDFALFGMGVNQEY